MGTPREDLADLLKEARLGAGFGSHAALAKRISVSRPVVSRAENAGQALPSDAVLEAWAGATGAPLGKLMDLYERAKSGTPEWFMSYRQAEAEASVLRCWSPVLVPGVVQCESYARAVLSAEPYTSERLDELVTARMERQAVIGRARLIAVIDQHVLERPIGTPAVMSEQCGYLAGLAEHPDIALHLVTEGTNVGLWGGFDLATRETSATVCLAALEDVTSTAPDLIGRAMLAFEQLLGAALPRAESLALVRALEEKWKQQI